MYIMKSCDLFLEVFVGTRDNHSLQIFGINPSTQG
jgi:hypothetical protein